MKWFQRPQKARRAATVTEADFKGLRALEGLVGERLKCGLVLHAGKEILPFGPRLWAAPIQALWSAGVAPAPRR